MPAPASSWRLRDGVEEDMKGILECWRDSFAEDGVEPMTPAHWRWKFRENPLGPSRFFVADHDGRVVGHYGTINQRFLVDGVPVSSALVVDVLTHPEYQRQGMFTKLGAYALGRCASDQRIQFTTGFPIRPAVIPGHMKVGWTGRFRVGTWVQLLSAKPVLKSKSKLLGTFPAAASVAGYLATPPLRAYSRALLLGRRRVRVEQLRTIDEQRLGDFLARLHAELPPLSSIQVRTPELLRWRYDSNPSAQYRYHVALDEHDQVTGMAVSRRALLLGVASTAIADLLVLPRHRHRRSVLKAIVADVRESAVRDRSALLAMMVSSQSPLLPSPWTLGFIPTPSRFLFITRELQAGCPAARDGLMWHLMWGDTDDV